MENLSFQLAKRGLVIGEDSNGGRTGLGTWSTLKQKNMGFEVNIPMRQMAPVLIARAVPSSFYFDGIQINANTSATPDSNQGAAFLNDGGNGTSNGCGLLTIGGTDNHFNGGNFLFVRSATVNFQMSISNVICEALTGTESCIHFQSNTAQSEQKLTI